MAFILIYCMIFLIPPFVSPLSFNLSSIGPNVSSLIKTQGTASISEEGIVVSEDLYRSARATYIEPLHLWDESSGKLADFHTHFSFIIQSIGNSSYADGLAFFLGPVNARIPDNSWGSGLGLGVRDNPSERPEDPFVAVEFDTASNGWDPRGPHVGIDINSTISAETTPWSNNMTAGKVNDAWISYNSTSQIFRVVFTSYVHNKTQTSSLEYAVDMRSHLPEWVSIGFSAATGLLTEIHNIKSWDFSSTQVSVPDLSPGAGKKMEAGKVIGLVVGLSVSIFGLILLGYYLWWKISKKGNEEELALNVSMENEFERGSGPKKFSYAELVRATDNFSEEHKLGEGGFGGVYLGFLRDLNSRVAVKRVSKTSKQGAKEYASEVKIISRLRHKNLVQLIGWCHEKRELLLVYEFLPNGSLDSHLFSQQSSLTWETRYKVVQGLASALLYLHEEGEQCVIHRDIKASNIMLDSGFNAKLGDFGLARLVDHEAEAQTTVMAGTMGYMAPELVMTGKASKESDVYSFGIVVLEIACGRKATGFREVRLVEWVWELYGRGVHLEAADPKLGREFDEEEMGRLMVVGLWCAHPDHTLRPSIRQAIHVLSFEPHEPPLLPSKFPVATYSVSPPHARTSLLFGTTDSYRTEPSGNTYNPVSAASSSPSLSLMYSI